MRDSIRVRLIVVFGGLAVVPLLIVGLVFGLQTWQVQREQALASQLQVARRVSTSVVALIEDLEDVLQMTISMGGLADLDIDGQRSLLAGLLSYEDLFEELSLVDGQGQEQVVLSRFRTVASADMGTRAGDDAFSMPASSHEMYYGPVYFDAVTNEPLMTVAAPVIDLRSGELSGVLIAEARIKRIWDLVSSERVAAGESIYVVDESGRVVAHRNPSIVLRETLFEAPDEGGLYVGLDGQRVILAMDQVRFGDRSMTIVAQRTVREALGFATSVMLTSAALLVVTLVIASVLGLLTVRQIVRPIEALASAAQAVADGDFTARAYVSGRDEIGALASTFNAMAEQLQSLFGALGQRVSERTRVLQATTEVSRAISVQLDPDALVREVVDLVQERFGLYYVGLFVVDASGEWAVLQAGTGTFGQMMLVQEHRLRVGGESMIGQCIVLDEPQMLMDTDEASVRFDNPLLPDTRSELVLPMHSRGRVIGAMTVQSDQPSAFDQAYVNVLQSMADQVATAMDNARLFSEAQGAVADLEAAQERYAGRVWADYTQERGVRGYAQTRRGLLSLHQQILPEVRQAMAAQRPIIGRGRSAQGIRSAIRPLVGSGLGETSAGGRVSPSALVAPILMGSQPIGALGLRDTEGVREWNEADIELVQAISAQFSEAAENLRLLEQTQQRESVERVTREVTEEIRAAVTVEDAVQRTLRALGRALGASRMTARLGARRDLIEQTRKGAEHE